MSIYWTIIPLLLFLYITVVGCVYAIQDYFIFKPVTLDKSYVFEFDQDFNEYFIPSYDDHIINAIHFKTDSISNGLVLYFHGNADHLQRWGHYAEDFTSKGYDVLMMDYRGFGKSKGECSELLMRKDAEQILNWASDNIDYCNLIIYGRSLGTGIATYIGAEYNSELVVLETPFYSIMDIFEEKGGIFKFPIKFKNSFENYKHIHRIESPVVIFHGTKDKIVPYSSSVKLEPLLNGKDTFYTIEGGKHKNLNEFTLFHDRLKYHFDQLD